MKDDTLDIDELDEIEDESELEAEPKAKAKAKAKGSETEEEPKPGLFRRIGAAITAPFTRIAWGDMVSVRSALMALIAFLLTWLLVVNLAPVRIVVWFWPIDIPKAVAFILGTTLTAALIPGTAAADNGHESGRAAVVASASYEARAAGGIGGGGTGVPVAGGGIGAPG